MNFQGEIVFLSGAITGIDGYSVLPPSGLEWKRLRLS